MVSVLFSNYFLFRIFEFEYSDSRTVRPYIKTIAKWTLECQPFVQQGAESHSAFIATTHYNGHHYTGRMIVLAG